MKKIIFLLIAMITLMSCQDEVIPDVKNFVGDEVNQTEIITMLKQIRTEYCEYENPDGSDVFMYTDYLKLPALTWDEGLYKAAEIQSVHMFKTGEFKHIWSDGTGTSQRLILAGCVNCGEFGENIASGYKDEKSVIIGWLNSEGHRKNILNSKFNTVAVARKGNYWTMVLANKS